MIKNLRTDFQILGMTIILITMLLLTSCSLKGNNGTNTDKTKEYGEATSELRIDYIDVGKGDCIVIRTDHFIYMIDTGYDDTVSAVSEFLDSNGIKTIDGMIITHFDKDHAGGAAKLIKTYNVKTLYEPDYEEDNNAYKKLSKSLETASDIKVNVVNKEVRFTLEGIDIYIYSGEKDSYTQVNDYSLVTKVVFNQDSYLFAGDVEKKRIDKLLKKDSSDNGAESFLKSDIFKVPHHGEVQKNTLDFIDRVSPKYAIITCDNEADISGEIISEFEKAGTKVYYNCNGNISITSNGTGQYKVSQKLI